MKTVFPMYFFEGGDLQIQLSLSLNGVNAEMILLSPSTMEVLFLYSHLSNILDFHNFSFLNLVGGEELTSDKLFNPF